MNRPIMGLGVSLFSVDSFPRTVDNPSEVVTFESEPMNNSITNDEPGPRTSKDHAVLDALAIHKYADSIQHFLRRDQFDLAGSQINHLIQTFLPTMLSCVKTAAGERR